MGLFSKTAKTEPFAGEKPWLARADWAEGRITSSSRSAVLALWAFALFWSAFSAFVALVVVPQEWHRGNHAVLFALLFPMVGVVLLIYVLNITLAGRRYGQSVFKMASVPGASGGALGGTIELNVRLRPEHGWHLRLSCVRRTTTGTGKDRSFREKILWQDEKWLRPDLPEAEGHTRIPVYFQLPAEQPESSIGRGIDVHWRLEASANVPGPNFHALFEVPVFRVPETPAPTGDPTAPYHLSLDEMRQQIHLQVQINDSPAGGKEFIFPPARNPGFAAATTAFWLFWMGIVVFLLWRHAPLLFVLGLGAVGLLMAVFSFDLWFRRNRVVLSPEQIQLETSWLGLKKQRSLKVSEVANLATAVGATAGHKAYYDLKIRMRDRREVTTAKNLSSKPVADWLVRQMVAAVKNSP